MRIEKPKVDVKGWFWIALVIGGMWYLLLHTAIKEYFIPNGVELAKLIAAVLMTAIIWLSYVLNQARSWENYGDEIRQWQADHDVRFAEQIFKVTFGKALEIYNIGKQQGGDETDPPIGG